MSSQSRPRIIFITGTDTGVGKTALAALLLLHLRRRGFPAYALKPFCSGDRADAELVCAIQDGALELDEINPYFFREPVAPLVAAQAHHRVIPAAAVLKHIARVQAKLGACSHLLIEGAGGLLAPLGRGYTALDLILGLKSEVIIVAANRLGTINHTALTASALTSAGVLPRRALRPRRTWSSRTAPSLRLTSKSSVATERAALSGIVMMNQGPVDPSSASNAAMLRQSVLSVPVFPIPFLRERPVTLDAAEKGERILKKTLARIVE